MHTMTFRAKLFTCFGLILAFAAAASVFSLYTIHSLRSEFDNEIQLCTTRLDQSRQIAAGLANMRSAVRGITLFSIRNNTTGLSKAESAFGASAQQMQDTVRTLAAAGLSGDQAASVDAIRSALNQWLQNYPDFVRMCVSGQVDEADKITVQKTTPVMDAIQKNAADFGNANLARRDAAIARFQAGISRCQMVVVIMGVLLLIVSGVALAVVTGLSRTLREITNFVEAGAQQIASASAQVSSASQSLAQGSSEQAASLEETSASTQEIGAMAQRNKENSDTATAMVNHSGEKFETTNQHLESMVQAMAEIQGSSDKISKIIKVIDEIAFQTNILALNAAVEAARAGESGAGFAVVADEVRNLAQRSAQAARDTSVLIEESIAKSSGGKSKVDQVAESIRVITHDALKVKNLVADVNQSSREQARGIEEIAKAMAQMEQVTQRNAANAQETSSAAEELSGQSRSLQDVVERLTVLVGSAGAR